MAYHTLTPHRVREHPLRRQRLLGHLSGAGLPPSHERRSSEQQPAHRMRRRSSPKPFKGGQLEASTTWREAMPAPDQAPPARSSRSSHVQTKAEQASPEPRTSRVKAEQAPPAAHSRRSSQPPAKADKASLANRRSKAEQASPERGRRSGQLPVKAEQASAGSRRRDKAGKASPVPRRRSARAQSQELPSESSEHELSPAQREFLRRQLSPGRKEPAHQRVKLEIDEQQRTRAHHDASHTASTSPEGDPHAAQHSKSPQPTKFEAALVEWERRRQLEEEVGKAATLAARRREADPGLRPGEIRSLCCQRVSPRRPRRPREPDP